MISAVITNLNGYHELWFTLQSVITELKSSGYEWEIIIVDNGSGGGSDQQGEMSLVKNLVAKVSEDYKIRLVLYETRKSCPGVRTAGMVEAKGELVCFMDAHVVLDHDYFKKTVPLFDDPDVYIVFAPEVYNSQKLYEYTASSQLELASSTATWVPMSEEPYPVAAACQACTMIRKDFLRFFFPEDELNYIPYSMDEPYTPFLAWMFGKKVLMNPKTYFAHRPWGNTPDGHADYESWRPMGAYALAGQEGFKKSYAYWKSTENLELPRRHREFIEKNAKVKFKDLGQYLTANGVTR